MLEKEHGGLANLCEKLGLSRKETSGLSRIANANLRHERGGDPYVMGSPLARKIEISLQLELGWMDTPPLPGELDADRKIANLIAIARKLQAEGRDNDLAHLLQIGHTFVEPSVKRANEN